MASLLIVDDERSAREYMRILLEAEGHRVRTAENGVQALLALEQEAADLVLSDLQMPEMDGLELLEHMSRRWAGTPVIIITAADDVEQIVDVVRRGAVNYLIKPAAPTPVLAALEKGLAARRKRDEVESEIKELVGVGSAIAAVREQVRLAATSDVPVLVKGETGTGKELVARAIHRYSNLADGPFVAHNCAVSPRDLFESEFFGHKRGSFTGAERDHEGLLSQANGGVLFLDELEALAPEHQAKLLRVLDDGEVRPVGSEKAHEVSVRFVAATNREPKTMIKGGELREDLYYRLRGFEIALPPLRDRLEDVPSLAENFLEEEDAGFEQAALDALCGFEWPGNVRELRNVVRSVRAIASGGRIQRHHLPEHFQNRVSLPGGGSTSSVGVPHGLTLREIEKRAIEQALEDCDHNRSKAARLLGIDRSTLRRKLKDFGLED